ncbi:ABC-type transporter Mla maintaining outer membrane lipid asymmetry, component MlaD [Gordonia malaquae]|uniref:MlaD family protein n=1 Tax=Gordonia malaquae TaxID=410332 RepID=UPI0008953E85|nr:MlaD family protein [Gordonia malaquae]SED68718.1 ABC-type transporter Mla maintaining outer membrane lipid asymmetry, component MlaD [Gordonia malaquae]
MAVYKDPSGRAPSITNLTLRGIGVLVVVVVAAYFLVSNATGKFEDNKTVTITTDAIGDGLKGGSEVKYRGLTVGKVSSVSVRDQSTSVKIELTGVNDDIRLRQGLAVNYTSANALGPTALDIVDPGQGALIRDGGSVYVSKQQSEQTSVSTLIRKLSKLVNALDQPAFNSVVKFVVDDSQTFADAGKLMFQIAQLTRDVQQRPVGQDLAIAADVSEGVADFMKPFIPGILINVDIADFFATDEAIKQTKGNLNDTGEVLFGALGGLLNKNYPALSSLLDVGLDLARPVARSASGLARTVYTIPQILDSIDKATPQVGERVQLQVALIVQTSAVSTRGSNVVLQ